MSMEARKKWARNGALLAGAMVLLAAWDYQAALLAPLRVQETQALREAADLGERIGKAQKLIAEVRPKEAAAAPIRKELDRLQRDIPAGAAMVALPALVKEHFGRSGIPVRLIRLNTTRNEPGIPGYERSFWSLALPIDEAGRNITPLLLAAAELDREHPFLKVLDFAIGPDPENPSGRIASLNLTTLMQK